MRLPITSIVISQNLTLGHRARIPAKDPTHLTSLPGSVRVGIRAALVTWPKQLAWLEFRWLWGDPQKDHIWSYPLGNEYVVDSMAHRLYTTVFHHFRSLSMARLDFRDMPSLCNREPIHWDTWRLQESIYLCGP